MEYAFATMLHLASNGSSCHVWKRLVVATYQVNAPHAGVQLSSHHEGSNAAITETQSAESVQQLEEAGM